MIRCRAPKALKDRLEVILQRRGHGDLSELIREAIYRHVEAEEERLGIPGPPPFYPRSAEPSSDSSQ